jgi:hypothetical protein
MVFLPIRSVFEKHLLADVPTTFSNLKDKEAGNKAVDRDH